MRAHRILICVAGALALTACVESTPTLQEPPDSVSDTLPRSLVIASAPITTPGVAGSISAHGAVAQVSYISLSPGTVANARTARVRNVTANGAPSEPIIVIAGGFDPVAVSAAADDEVEISVIDSAGATTLIKATVPKRRPPSIVRTSPPKGRTDVAVKVVPGIVFSAPIDPQSLAGEVLLRAGGSTIAASVSISASAPWVVEVSPASPLQPLTTYELVINSGVRDLAGNNFEGQETVTFTTGLSLQFEGRIAFVSTRDGSPSIYLANGDGSGVARLTSGDKPAWSPDGNRIVFERGRQNGGAFPQGAEIRIINSDGSGETKLIDGMAPAWSPDGNRIAFVDSAGISVINLDGTGLTRLIRHDVDLRGTPGFYVGAPAWSPDGTRIAFEHANGELPQSVYVMKSDGSQRERVAGSLPSFQSAECAPDFSPDGSSILFWSFGSGIAMVNGIGNAPQTLFFASIPEISCFSAPVWSGDGSAAAFGRHQIDAGRQDWRGRIYVVARTGGPAHQLIPDVVAPANPSYSDYDVAWSRVAR